MRQGDEFPTSFCFFKKLYIKSKQVVSKLDLIYFGRHLIGHTMKNNCIIFQAIDPKIWSILIFYERV